ncbi:choline-binding surface protein A [Streptococcus pneumoniae]|nr:choline-binding surface protein A [Streptococcus pneumoniae]
MSKGQEIYDEAQKKVQEKADVIRKIDEERQIINGEVQKAYLELRQAQEEKNKYPGRQEYTKKFNEANKKVDEITKKQKAKDEEYTKKMYESIPDVGPLLTKLKAEKDKLAAAKRQLEKAKVAEKTEKEAKVKKLETELDQAREKVKKQAEEDKRNYPTNTLKTLELEIAESYVKVKEAELELAKEEARELQTDDKIKQAKEKVESEKAEAKRLEELKIDRKKAEEEAKRKAAEEEAKQKRVDSPVFAGTSLDNTYQAPAAKKGKQELPSTGAKDNVALASLGFLGLFLGALPFVKHKN